MLYQYLSGAIKNYASRIFHSWMMDDHQTMLYLLEKSESVLDVGCGNGVLTKLFSKKLKPKKLVGLDSFIETKKIRVIKSDLNKKFPFKSDTFDAIISHYSFEHLYNTGLFISESYRVLKKGGYTVIATDNLSAWPNIISLLLGFQPFSTTNGIGKRAIGNPLALRSSFGEIEKIGEKVQWRESGEFSHNKVLAYQALIDAYKEFGFSIESVVGIGYFPAMGALSRFFANIDKRHAHFLILKARKL